MSIVLLANSSRTGLSTIKLSIIVLFPGINSISKSKLSPGSKVWLTFSIIISYISIFCVNSGFKSIVLFEILIGIGIIEFGFKLYKPTVILSFEFILEKILEDKNRLKLTSPLIRIFSLPLYSYDSTILNGFGNNNSKP